MSNGISAQEISVIIAGEVGPPGTGGTSNYLNVNDVTPTGIGPGDPFNDPQLAINALTGLTADQHGLVRIFPGTYPGDLNIPDFTHVVIVEPYSVTLTGSTGNPTIPMVTMGCCSSLMGAVLENVDDKDIGILLTGGTSKDFRILENLKIHNLLLGKLLVEPIVVATTAGLDVIDFHHVTILVNTAGAATRKETANVELNTWGCSFKVIAGGGKIIQHNGGNWFSHADDFVGDIDIDSGAQLFVAGTNYDKDRITGEGTLVPSTPAAGVSYDNTASGLSAENVQDAIDEIAHHVDTRDPINTDDDTQGFSRQSYWVNSTTDIIFACTDASTGGALWKPVTHPNILPASPTPTTSNPTTSSSTPVNMPEMTVTRIIDTDNSFALIVGHATIALDNTEEAELALAVDGSIVGKSGSVMINATGATTGQWNISVVALVAVTEGSRTFSLQWFAPASDTIVNVGTQRNLAVMLIDDFAGGA